MHIHTPVISTNYWWFKKATPEYNMLNWFPDRTERFGLLSTKHNLFAIFFFFAFLDSNKISYSLTIVCASKCVLFPQQHQNHCSFYLLCSLSIFSSSYFFYCVYIIFWFFFFLFFSSIWLTKMQFLPHKKHTEWICLRFLEKSTAQWISVGKRLKKITNLVYQMKFILFFSSIHVIWYILMGAVHFSYALAMVFR